MDENLEDILGKGEFGIKGTKRKNSKAKGNRYENQVAKRLNKMFETDEFQRTPGSGAFATTHKLPEHLQVAGDLITPINFRFIIECKHGYSVDFHDSFKAKSTIISFIIQAEKEVKSKPNKDFLILYKKDYKDEIVIVNKSYNITPELCLNGKYFIYLSKDFFKLPKDVFFD